MKKFIVLTLIVSILYAGSLAMARPEGWGHGMGPRYGEQEYEKANLNLTQGQSEELQTLRDNYLKKVTPLQNRMMSLRSELRLMWNTSSPDRGKILAKQKELFEVERLIKEKATIYRLDCRAALTPEQQTALTAFREGMGRGPGQNHSGKW